MERIQPGHLCCPFFLIILVSQSGLLTQWRRKVGISQLHIQCVRDKSRPVQLIQHFEDGIGRCTAIGPDQLFDDGLLDQPHMSGKRIVVSPFLPRPWRFQHTLTIR